MPIEIKFNDGEGWSFFLRERGHAELWLGTQIVAIVPGPLLSRIITHYFLGAQLGHALMQSMPLDRLPPQPAPARTAPPAPDSASREGWERARSRQRRKP